MIKFYIIAALLFSCNHNKRMISSVTEKKILTKNDFLIKRISTKYSGFFQGIKEKGNAKTFRVTECNFSYEKAVDIEHSTEKEFQFERFSLSFEGIDKKGETSFDSVSYVNSNYIEKYISFDYSKSFGPYLLKSEITSSGKDKNAYLTFIKHRDFSATMLFKHTEIFGAKESKFFNFGEKRDISLNVNYNEFDKKISLKDVWVVIKSSKATKFGNYGEEIIVTEIKCSEFKPLPDA